MGSLLTYSGLTTKVKAMKSRLLKESQYRELASFHSVPQAVDYLDTLPAYRPFLSGNGEKAIHRGKIEELLLQSKYRDFSKLYRFSNLSQRKFLDLYFMHYEIEKLKRCLRGVIGHHPLELDLSLFQDFFTRHSGLDLLSLSTSKDLAEFTENLAGSRYYEMMARLSRQDHITLFDYEMNLDMLYFKTMWKEAEKHLKRDEREEIAELLGRRLVMLNIQWIYRCIAYYHMSALEIYALLIPIRKHLKPEQTRSLANSGSTDEFLDALRTTYYGSQGPGRKEMEPNPEKLTRQVLNRVHKMTEQRDPYSIATVNSYLYFKELEIERIIHIIECIRYGHEPSQILSSIVNVTW